MKIQRTHTRTVFISDIHIPYEDKKALAMAMEIIKDMKLTDKDNIIIGGDLLDYYPISSFSPDMTSSNIEIEIFEGVEFLNDLRHIAKKQIYISLKVTMSSVCKKRYFLLVTL